MSLENPQCAVLELDNEADLQIDHDQNYQDREVILDGVSLWKGDNYYGL